VVVLDDQLTGLIAVHHWHPKVEEYQVICPSFFTQGIVDLSLQNLVERFLTIGGLIYLCDVLHVFKGITDD